MRILAISGSLREGSYNTSLARAAVALAPAGVEVELFDGLGLVPPYLEDADQPGTELPQAVRRLRDEIDAADALFFATPEYNGSVPGVLKNAIDWASARHRGSSFRYKTSAVAGASTGAFGGIWAQQDLRRILGIAGARVIDGEVAIPEAQHAFDDQGRLTDPVLAERLRAHLESLVREAAPVPVAA
jgi:chromate reductase, NAD(P)H dehydrogenase (quinone)